VRSQKPPFRDAGPVEVFPLAGAPGEREAPQRADLQSDPADLLSGRCLRVRRATAPVCDGLPRLSIVINLAALATFTGANAAHNHSARADYRVLENLKARESGYDGGDRLLDRPEASQMPNSGPAAGPDQRDARFTAK
jgi:hypothetical protein